MTPLSCSGSAVGLPCEQMDNSEVSHPHFDTGRYVPQGFYKVNDAILNGGVVDTVFTGEDRILVPSEKVRIYDLQSKMNEGEVAAITGGKFNVIVCNYANCDMLGHAGIMDEAILAVEAVYATLRRVVDALSDKLLDAGGSLSDLASTVLAMLGGEKPVDMTGRSLIKFV